MGKPRSKTKKAISLSDYLIF